MSIIFLCYSSDRYIQYSKVPSLHYQASLPRLPIPKLNDSCERYLKAIRPTLSDEEYQRTEKFVADFQRPGGSGECKWVAMKDEILVHKYSLNVVYQERLIAFDKENKHTSYISGKETFLEQLCYLVFHGLST